MLTIADNLADAIDDKLKTIDAIDEELTELEDMVEQLEQYTGSLRECYGVDVGHLDIYSNVDTHNVLSYDTQRPSFTK